MVWDAATGASVWTRNEPGLNAMSVAFNPAGKSLAAGYGFYSGTQVGRVKIWDVASGKEIKAFPGPNGGADKLAFHPDGKRLALAGSEVAEVWNLETGGKLQDLKGHAKWIYCLAYSPDGKWLATGGWDNTVKLRDAATGVEALTIFAHEQFVLNLAFSPDSRTLVTTSEDRSVRLWDVRSGRRSATFHGHTDFVWAVAFRPDGRRNRDREHGGGHPVLGPGDEPSRRRPTHRLGGGSDRFPARRASGSLRGGEFTDGRPAHEGLEHRHRRTRPDPGRDHVRSAARRLRARSASYIEAVTSQTSSVTSPDGRLVASHGRNEFSTRSKEYSGSSVIIRDARTGNVVQTLAGHSADITSLGFSPDGRRLVTASQDPDIEALGHDDMAGRSYTPRAHRGRGLSGLQPRRDPDRLGGDRFRGPRLECHAARAGGDRRA